MPDTNKATSIYDDTGTLILFLVIGLACCIALTPVGILSSLFPAAVYSSTKRANWVASIFLIGLLWIGITIATGTFEFTFLRDGRQWFAAIGNLQAWLTLAPVGMCLASAIVLAQHAAGASPLAAIKLGQAVALPKRAPLAGWFHERLNARPANRKGKITLGSLLITGEPVTISEADLNRHMLLAGTTGAGKTVAILNLVDASADVAIVIVDGKGDVDLARNSLAIARARGQKAYLFGAPPIKSCVYNPLSRGSFTSLADRIMTLREWSEPHYQTLARGYLQTAFKVLKESGTPINLLTLESSLSFSSLLSIARRVAKSDPQKQHLIEEVCAQEKAYDHIEGLRAELRNFAFSTLGPLFDTRVRDKAVIDLVEARRERALVYFCLPALQYPDYAAAVGKLIINDIKASAATAKLKWRIILDEFSVFAGPQVLNLINMGRGYGVSAVLATQSLADIAQGSDKNGDKFLDQVVGSINNYMIFRLNAPNDCEYVAGIAGTKADVAYTAQTERGTETGAGSARSTNSYRVHPDVIKSLRVGEAIFVNKNDISSASNFEIIMTRNPKVPMKSRDNRKRTSKTK